MALVLIFFGGPELPSRILRIWSTVPLKSLLKHWRRQMHISTLSIFGVAVLGLLPISAQAASECPVTGVMSSWGINSTGYFNVSSGGTCLLPVKMDGVIASSSVSQKPAHGTLRKVNVSTYTYTAKAGYKGNDAFAVSFTGKGPSGSGTSVITMNAMVQ
ncbi:hypothetical protein ABIE89_000316 [Bradyrhizobium niftali]|uniref:hypothetical protein n=1 Tax=Bradyrhizobium niftali TaxID=2560055 RepID=UPI0038363866